MTEQTEKLATEFSRVLCAQLGSDKMAEVRRRNAAMKAAGYTNACASHDFCDANVVMGQAFDNLGIPIWGTDGHMLDSSTDLWNAAWDVAKTREFRATKPARLMGRLTNGFEADGGRRTHAVPVEVSHYGHGRALCGAQPGRRSCGWDTEGCVGYAITCPRCAAKVAP